MDATIQLLTDARPARVLLAQVRQPFSNRNGREGPVQGGRKAALEEMGVVELRQELAEASNTIFQLRKNAEPNKRQRREGWQGGRRSQDQPSTEQQGPKKGVHVPEGPAKGTKQQPTSPTKVQTSMLRTSRRTSDSDDELMYARANLVRAREDAKP